MSEKMIAPLPHVAIQVFSETQPIAAVIEEARHDRRLAKVNLRIQAGGAAAAVEAYRDATTPNVIVIETLNNADTLLNYLDELASCCDEGTRVVVIGHVNDVPLYRELVRRGVSDYLVAPIEAVDLVAALSGIFTSPNAKPIGRAVAIIGAKGGVGASTIAHNVAFSIGLELNMESVIVDLDLPYGTAGLDFNQDPPQGVMEAAFEPSRVDSNMIERLLSRCADRLSLMAAPSSLDRLYDFAPDTFAPLTDALRSTIPAIVLDVPHMWTSWVRNTLVSADEIVIVAEPDLANLRNAKNLMDMLSNARPNDPRPHLVMNKVGLPRRPEISVQEFSRALSCTPLATIGFDAQLFGTASNNGQMLTEVQAKSKTAESIMEIAKVLMKRADVKKEKKSMLSPLLSKITSRYRAA